MNIFLKWNDAGRPKYGVDYDLMKSTRSKFRNDLKLCKNNDKTIRDEKLAESLRNKDNTRFWKTLRSKKSKRVANVIDGAATNENIANIFRQKFLPIFDNPNCQSDFNQGSGVSNNNNYYILPSDIKNGIDNLNVALGHDNIHSNHLKYCPVEFRSKLRDFFNCIISHSYMPSDMLKGVVRPTVKNRFGNLNTSDNYRPVMASTNFLKLFEYCILPAINDNAMLHANQFGFVKGSSTIGTITVLKEVIYKYIDNRSSVYGAFLDMSKAFDCVNHEVLFSTLSDRDVPSNIISTIRSMYTQQRFAVSWSEYHTTEAPIRNGVRQGGVISPILFNMYIDRLVRKINSLYCVCRLGPFPFGLIAYADDMVCLSPSLNGLEFILNELKDELSILCLRLNFEKSKVVLFGKGRQNCRPVKIGMNLIEHVNHVTYLGVILTSNLSNKNDITRCTQSFLRQFNAMYRKYGDIRIGIKIYLFKIYCMSFYGCETWHDLSGCLTTLKGLGLAYHKCIKRLHGISYRTSNHDICDSSNLFVFEHYLSVRFLSFLFRFRRNKNASLKYLEYYLLKRSKISNDIISRFKSMYDVSDIFSNDFDALISRIQFVSDHEPRYVRPENV